ncbi:MAG: hypothetical protein AVO38_13870, partial [delta proteobacterium ML8_D]
HLTLVDFTHSKVSVNIKPHQVEFKVLMRFIGRGHKFALVFRYLTLLNTRWIQEVGVVVSMDCMV